jgi:hypothetical protein
MENVDAGGMRNAYRIFFGKPYEKKPLRRYGSKLKNRFKVCVGGARL